MLRSIALFIIANICSLHTSAKLGLPGIIGDNMVLQRGMPVPVWGWATPGAAVTVTFNHKTFKTKTGADGSWKLKMDSYSSGGPYTMHINGDGSTILIKNILIGDVWLASGQSNMEFGIQSDRDGAEAIAQATDSLIRCFFVPWATALNEQKDIAASPQGSLNGKWIVCSPAAMANTSWAWHGFSAPAYYFAQVLRKENRAPVGLIGSYKGGTPAQAWVSISGLQQDAALQRHVAKHESIVSTYDSLQKIYPQKMQAYREALEKQATPRPQQPASPDGGFGAPGNLFNGMIAPIIPYAIKGVIWYQGESNGDRITDAMEYQTLFPRLIKDWREKWAQGTFPFLYVQLTSFRAPAKAPVEGIWPWVRDAQLQTLALPKTGMAVTTDVGDANDIHPKSKVDVGKRLALAALKVAYGKDVVNAGPMYASMKVNGNTAIIRFTHAGKGLAIKDTQVLEGFAVAGSNRQFVWARAVLKGNVVEVSADSIDQPVAVRYNWADNPAGNLFNKDGLPASPFRTDNWNE